MPAAAPFATSRILDTQEKDRARAYRHGSLKISDLRGRETGSKSIEFYYCGR